MDLTVIGIEDLKQYVHTSRELPTSHQVVFKFPNGYGASLIKGATTYGGKAGLFEIAVMRWKGEEYGIDYTTPITDDVLGYLNKEEVVNTLTQILNLKGDTNHEVILINAR